MLAAHGSLLTSLPLLARARGCSAAAPQGALLTCARAAPHCTSVRGASREAQHRVEQLQQQLAVPVTGLPGG